MSDGVTERHRSFGASSGGRGRSDARADRPHAKKLSFFVLFEGAARCGGAKRINNNTGGGGRKMHSWVTIQSPFNAKRVPLFWAQLYKNMSSPKTDSH